MWKVLFQREPESSNIRDIPEILNGRFWQQWDRFWDAEVDVLLSLWHRLREPGISELSTLLCPTVLALVSAAVPAVRLCCIYFICCCFEWSGEIYDGNWVRLNHRARCGSSSCPLISTSLCWLPLSPLFTPYFSTGCVNPLLSTLRTTLALSSPLVLSLWIFVLD